MNALIEQVVSGLMEAYRASSMKSGNYPIISQISIPELNILNYVQSFEVSPRFYWHDRERDFECGAVGATAMFHNLGFSSLDRCNSLLENHPQRELVRIVGGLNFAPDACDDQFWQGVPSDCFFLPQILLERTGSKYTAKISLNTKGLTVGAIGLFANELVDSLGSSSEDEVKTFSHCYKLELQNEEWQVWQSQVKKALTSIEKGHLEKVVLARSSILSSEYPSDPYAILRDLCKKESSGVAFGISFTNHKSFLGVSPETLIRLVDDTLSTDAIGGTGPVGASEEETIKIAERMLSDDKLLSEHRFIEEDLIKKVRSQCTDVASSEVKIMRLAAVQHLYATIKGRLSNKVNLAELLRLFHPTPAVCGEPYERSMRFLRGVESFRRGWYASPVGIISRDFTEFRVAIRSLLHQKNIVSVFTGAGIVAGSSAESEYEEIERKALTIISLLTGEKKARVNYLS